MWVNNLPKVATQWNSDTTQDSNRGPRVHIPSALTTRPLSHTYKLHDLLGFFAAAEVCSCLKWTRYLRVHSLTHSLTAWFVFVLILLIFHFYVRQQELLYRVLAIAILSVRPSVTRVDQVKTVQARIIKSSPSAAPKTLVSGSVTLFQKFHRGHPNRGPFALAGLSCISCGRPSWLPSVWACEMRCISCCTEMSYGYDLRNIISWLTSSSCLSPQCLQCNLIPVKRDTETCLASVYHTHVPRSTLTFYQSWNEHIPTLSRVRYASVTLA